MSATRSAMRAVGSEHRQPRTAPVAGGLARQGAVRSCGLPGPSFGVIALYIPCVDTRESEGLRKPDQAPEKQNFVLVSRYRL